MVLALTVSALLSAPRAPADAALVTYVPKLDALSTLMPFFTAAGSRSTLLRPEGWRAVAHPVLEFDVTDAASLEAAGIDPRSSLSASRLGDSSVSCVTVKDVRTYVDRSEARLQRLGEVSTKKEGGVTVVGARDALHRVLAGYVLAGSESCAISGHGRSVEKQLPELAKALGKAAKGPGFSLAQGLGGAAQVVVPKGSPLGALALSGAGLTLTADARARGLPVAPLAGAGASPFAALAPAGLATVRARLEREALAPVLERVLREIPNARALVPLASQVAPLLTGNVALYASKVKVTQGLRSREARYFAVKNVLLAEVTDAAAVRALLDAAKLSTLASREGTVEVGLSGTTLYLANDTGARDVALGALEKAAGKQAHAGEAIVDPRLLADGLSQVPLLEVLQAPELAGLVAAATELGPLLLASKRVSGWLDTAGPGQHRAQATWQLDAEKFPATGTARPTPSP
ncbi:MAG: hypothetical protein AB1730_00720 [Myxococcota bacterium]